MAKAKKAAKVTTTKKTSKKAYNPHESMIIQGGVVFIIISAIAIFAYTFAVYGMK
jgi:heme/copper-type cytochrome/quinol oxidase subunit 3